MVFRDIYEQEAYDRACDFCADFSFEDGALRKTRIQLPVERLCRYAYLLDKDIENTGIRFSLSFNLEISNSYKDKSYDEFKSHVNKMAREWLENAIRELEGEGDAVYHFNPDTLFDRREIRDLFLAPYSKEGSGRALKMVLRDLYYGERHPIYFSGIARLDSYHYAVLKAILAHHAKYGVDGEIRKMVEEMEAADNANKESRISAIMAIAEVI